MSWKSVIIPDARRPVKIDYICEGMQLQQHNVLIDIRLDNLEQ